MENWARTILLDESANTHCGKDMASWYHGIPKKSSDSVDDDFWDSDDDNEQLNFLYIGGNTRVEKYIHPRLCWEDHLEKLQHEGMFSRTYRMSYEAFLKLLLFICPSLQCRNGNSDQEGAKLIRPEIVMAIALRWLGGGGGGVAILTLGMPIFAA